VKVKKTPKPIKALSLFDLAKQLFGAILSLGLLVSCKLTRIRIIPPLQVSSPFNAYRLSCGVGLSSTALTVVGECGQALTYLNTASQTQKTRLNGLAGVEEAQKPKPNQTSPLKRAIWLLIRLPHRPDFA
jgi:hypothetical protein